MSSPSSLIQPFSSLTPAEQSRLTEMVRYESAAYEAGKERVVGVDEAGRGPLAGPVVATACYLPRGIYLDGIDDSKKLTEKKREKLAAAILADPSIHSYVAVIPAEVIDEVNIYQATIQGMLEAVKGLDLAVDHLLVDGLQLPHPTIEAEKIIRGDQKSQSIAAASILAKVYRDQLMRQFHEQWPQYGFDRHKGYGTRLHMEALENHGPCPIHRMSFAPCQRFAASL